MAEDGLQRKLAAILAADVVSYSRMMSEDEAGTLARLKAHRHELFDPKVKEYRGRIFKTMGDGAMVEFKSAIDAVNCAIDIQRSLCASEEGVAEDRHIRLRIGISMGDVIVEGQIFTAEASTSPPAWRASPNQMASAFRAMSTRPSGEQLSFLSTTWASRRLRTSPPLCTPIAFIWKKEMSPTPTGSK